ncbi:ribonuclease Z [Flavobacterium sp. NKUCC04_CG]|uniref:ribonuclease Z n=1 Tax=Flavobacterium sp. NKUCC04_CG TaxID=2842121 RepID=UPI001C5BA060|nr:ribonuclease Z [Flavobacterium sp. NKUCC04_CG]MBW3519713.1 ribonuclease Z [Flavobacterium sp. NKUCC04_CG]
MKIKEKGHTLVIKKSEDTITEFIAKVKTQYETLKKHNLIFDLSQEPVLELESLNQFLELVSMQTENKKSLVLVMSSVNYNDFDEELIIVPSVQEAHDIIEMDEIERDLGF